MQHTCHSAKRRDSWCTAQHSTQHSAADFQQLQGGGVVGEEPHMLGHENTVVTFFGIGLPPMMAPSSLLCHLWCRGLAWGVLQQRSPPYIPRGDWRCDVLVGRGHPLARTGLLSMSLLLPLSPAPTAVPIYPWNAPPVPPSAAAAAAVAAAVRLLCLFRWTCSSTASLRRLRSPQLRRAQQVCVCVFWGGC